MPQLQLRIPDSIKTRHLAKGSLAKLMLEVWKNPRFDDIMCGILDTIYVTCCAGQDRLGLRLHTGKEPISDGVLGGC